MSPLPGQELLSHSLIQLILIVVRKGGRCSERLCNSCSRPPHASLRVNVHAVTTRPHCTTSTAATIHLFLHPSRQRLIIFHTMSCCGHAAIRFVVRVHADCVAGRVASMSVSGNRRCSGWKRTTHVDAATLEEELDGLLHVAIAEGQVLLCTFWRGACDARELSYVLVHAGGSGQLSQV